MRDCFDDLEETIRFWTNLSKYELKCEGKNGGHGYQPLIANSTKCIPEIAGRTSNELRVAVW